MIDTVIFDFDGVILDTETPDFQSWQSVFRSHGVELDLARWTRYVGSGSHNFDACGHLEKLTGQGVDRRQVATARRQRYLRQVNSQPLMPGVADRIAEARALGLKLGVASSSSRGWVEGHLHRLGILQMFAAVPPMTWPGSNPTPRFTGRSLPRSGRSRNNPLPSKTRPTA